MNNTEVYYRNLSPCWDYDICDYNPQCFRSGGLMLDDIIMNLFMDTT